MDLDVQQTTAAVLGVGQMARTHYLNALMSDYRVRLGAFVEPYQVQIARAEHSCWPLMFLNPKPPVFASYDTMLEAELRGDIPRIDVAFVLTHLPGRLEIVLALLAAGKHVLVEKPFADRLVDAVQMADAADAAGRVLVVQHQYRVWSRRFSEIAAAGLGDNWTYARARWIRIFEHRPGPYAWLTYDLGTHVLDPLCSFGGWPDFVQAQPVPMPEEERATHVHAWLTTSRGQVAEVRLSDVLATRVGGTSVLWRRGNGLELDLRFPTRELETPRFTAVLSGPQHGMHLRGEIGENPPTVPAMVATNIADFVSVVRGERRLEDTALTSAAEGVRLTRVLTLLDLAHQTGHTVSIDEVA